LFYGGGWHQLGVQALSVLVASVYVAITSWVILWVLNKLIGLRVTREAEIKGLDWSEHGVEITEEPHEAPASPKVSKPLRTPVLQ
jgi:Amt family ammonium transporter